MLELTNRSDSELGWAFCRNMVIIGILHAFSRERTDWILLSGEFGSGVIQSLASMTFMIPQQKVSFQRQT